VGAEFQVNTYTTNKQLSASVAADADGDFVVTWSSDTQDGSQYGVFGQRYTSAGATVGAEFQVNTYTTQQQGGAVVAAAIDGDFVVVWQSDQDGDGYGVFGQRYTSAGAAVGAEFQVNTYTTGPQLFPAVAADADGDFVVIWESYSQDGSHQGVFGRRYTSAGATVGAEFQVNTYTTGIQGSPAVVADADGDFVVVWDSAPYSGPSGQDGSLDGVFGQRYTSAGAAIGDEFQVNTFTTGNQLLDGVAADVDGDFVVVWSYRGAGDIAGVFGQRYTSAGAAVGGEFQVNTYTTNKQLSASVAADADGDFVVVWTSGDPFNAAFGQDGSQYGVFGQRYASTGAAVGAEFQVNTYTTGAQAIPAVAAAADGAFVVVWSSSNAQDGSVEGLFGQRFCADVDADGVCDGADNCPSETNPDQLNSDSAGGGDVCDPCPERSDDNCAEGLSGAASVGPGGGGVGTCDVGGTDECTGGPNDGQACNDDDDCGAITVSVPPGALGSDTTISMTENLAGFDVDVFGPGLSPVLKISMGPDGQSFAAPVTVTFRWDDRDGTANDTDQQVDLGVCAGGTEPGASCDEDPNQDCAGVGASCARTCAAGADRGEACTSNGQCTGSTCLTSRRRIEKNLRLAKDGKAFSKQGIGPGNLTCASHQVGGGCEAVVVSCTDTCSGGTCTVTGSPCSVNTDCLTKALCCDQANNEWAFQTCRFSEFSLVPVPVVSPLGAGLLAGALGLGLGAARRRWVGSSVSARRTRSH